MEKTYGTKAAQYWERQEIVVHVHVVGHIYAHAQTGHGVCAWESEFVHVVVLQVQHRW